MSYIVHGVEIPRNCGGCDRKRVCAERIYLLRRPDSCPLEEIKTPHGDLADKDKLMQEFMDSDLDHLQRDDWKEVIQIVQDAPTIIEAEGDGE